VVHGGVCGLKKRILGRRQSLAQVENLAARYPYNTWGDWGRQMGPLESDKDLLCKILENLTPYPGGTSID